MNIRTTLRAGRMGCGCAKVDGGAFAVVGSKGLNRSASSAASALLGCFALCCGARADTLLNQTTAVGSGAPPFVQTLSVTQADSLEVDVTDQAFPVALASLQTAVTQGGTVIGSVSGTGSIKFAATPGDYQIRLVGVPAAPQNAGSASVNVTRTTDPTPRPSLLAFVAGFQLPIANPLQSNVTQQLTIPAAGSYTFNLRDQVFPVALPTLTGALFYGSTLVQTLTPGTPVVVSLNASVPGAAAQYQVTVIAAADPTATAGLYSLDVTGGPSNVSAYSASTGVGTIAAPQNVVVPSAETVSLNVTDFQFPSALTSLGAILTSGAAVVAKTLVPGTASGSSPATSLQLWRVATAGTAAGAYQITVTSGAATLYSDQETVASTSAAGQVGYSFPFTAATAGSFTATVTDLEFPSALSKLQFAVAQNQQVLGQASAAGSLNVALAAGAATLLVAAQPPTGGAGFVGLNVSTTGANATSVLDTTQAVGSTLNTTQFDAVASGQYSVTLTDDAWPAPFASLALAVTRGSQLIGKVYGGGTFSIPIAPGNYFATLIATPDAQKTAGLYTLVVQSAVPTVTISASPASVPAGQGVHLSWSSTGASACAASDGWSGSQATSGANVAEGPLAAQTTFTITCTGPGGTSAPASVTVTVTSAPASGGGHGSIGLADLALLAALAALGRRRAGRAARAGG